MKRMVGYCLALFFVALAPLWGGAAEERLWVDGAINGKPVRFVFDTGTGTLVLFSQTATRLGLSYTNAEQNAHLAPGKVAVGWTEVCYLQILGSTFSNGFAVVEKPAMLLTGVDGMVGWPNLSNNIMRIEAVQGTITSLPQLPAFTTNWTRFKLLAGSDVLCLEAPQPGGTPSIIFVDTGDEDGVKLAPELWRAWRIAHAHQPLTFNAYYTPSVGLVVAEEGWADRLSLGPLLVTEVPVMAADKGDLARGPITLGMAALKRLEFIVDGKHGVAYLRAKTTPPSAYEHNRLGAVFTPLDMQHEDLLAHVVEGSPAWVAGIRDGDVLLRIWTLDVTKWRTDPAVMPMHRFWSRPAGTKHQLTLRRGAQEYQAEVVLRQILGPESVPQEAHLE